MCITMMDRICSPENLQFAFKQVKKNKGTYGVDHQSIDEFDECLEENLEELSRDLRDGTYKPQPVRRAIIPKAGSTEGRPLGIPTVHDRVAQAALRQELEPLFEADFVDRSYGFRPGRSAIGALRRVDALIKAGYDIVVEADIEKYFDTIPHEPLLDLVRAIIDDEQVIGLIRAFLEADVMEKDAVLRTPEQGTPQGGVTSPLLANIYLNPLDHLMIDKGHEQIRYADDFVIPCRNRNEAEAALGTVRNWMRSAHLTLHPEKTRIVDPTEHGGFDFLGYHLEGERRSPREKSVRKLQDFISDTTNRRNPDEMPDIIQKVNEVLKGWFEYFQYSTEPFHYLDGWVTNKLRNLLRVRHHIGRVNALAYWPDTYFRDEGLFSFEHAHAKAPVVWR